MVPAVAAMSPCFITGEDYRGGQERKPAWKKWRNVGSGSGRGVVPGQETLGPISPACPCETPRKVVTAV